MYLLPDCTSFALTTQQSEYIRLINCDTQVNKMKVKKLKNEGDIVHINFHPSAAFLNVTYSSGKIILYSCHSNGLLEDENFDFALQPSASKISKPVSDAWSELFNTVSCGITNIQSLKNISEDDGMDNTFTQIDTDTNILSTAFSQQNISPYVRDLVVLSKDGVITKYNCSTPGTITDPVGIARIQYRDNNVL